MVVTEEMELGIHFLSLLLIIAVKGVFFFPTISDLRKNGKLKLKREEYWPVIGIMDGVERGEKGSFCRGHHWYATLMITIRERKGMNDRLRGNEQSINRILGAGMG